MSKRRQHGNETRPDATTDALLALALTAANSEVNHISQLNAAGITPALQVTWISSPVTPKVSGKFLVIGVISATDATVDELVTAQLYRDPVNATGAPGGTAIGPIVLATNASANGVTATIAWIDTVSTTATHTWGISLVAGHNLTVGVNNAAIIAIELPG
jgi:hypothetical protein